jgi:hypothetical protein
MVDQDQKPKDVLPENFSTLEEFSEFWDTHSTADYEEVIEPVEVEIVHRDPDQPLVTGEASRFGLAAGKERKPAQEHGRGIGQGMSGWG